jgi:O-succinylbenzoate synthase
MKTQLSLFKFQLPLVKGLAWNQREIGILRLCQDSKVGFGEVSPLPGLSHETFEETLQLNPKIPSVAWGIQCALWNASHRSSSEIKICGLILEHEDEPLERAQVYENSGFEVLKLKVGSDLKSDLGKIQNIIKGTKYISLRLDFNGRGNPRDIEFLCKNIPRERVEYLEDPVDAALFPEFSKTTQIPLAVDQNLGIKGDYYSVVKPTKWGPQCLQNLVFKKTVLSSSFESNLGLFHLGRLASQGDLPLSQGLDTAKYFTENIFELKISNGRMSLPSDENVKSLLEKLVSKLKPIVEVEL